MEPTKKINHNWKPETMGECAETFMDIIGHHALNMNDLERVKELVSQYDRIRNDVAAMPNSPKSNISIVSDHIEAAILSLTTICNSLNDVVKAATLFNQSKLADKILWIRNMSGNCVSNLKTALGHLKEKA